MLLKMARTEAMADAAMVGDLGSAAMDGPPSVCLRSRPCSSERDGTVRDVKASLQARLGPYEPVLTYLQSVMLWERPVQSVLLYTVVNVVFWFFALTSLRMLFLLAWGLALVVCADTWRNKIWPEIRAKRMDESENESWGLVQPGVISVPELCHHVAEAWVSGIAFTASLRQYKQLYPGKFCVLSCGILSCLAVVGRYIPGLVLSYSAVLALLLAPLAALHQVFQHVSVRLEPVLQRLDFSVSGYMMSKPIDNQFLRRPIHAASGEASDSEEELAAFCPTFDDAVVARELSMTDSEHSDAEVSYTENGTFNLSRGQTPLTEGSEDLDRHSDAEESFTRDLQDFPSVNPDASLLDDEDDSIIGLPSLGLSGHRASLLDDSDDDDHHHDLCFGGLNPAVASAAAAHFLGGDLAGDLAGVIASNMIQAALVGALQPQPPAAPRREGLRSGAHHHHHRGYRKQSSSELDTDWDGEDFEMLDQSELNQMDPLGGAGGGGDRRGGRARGARGPTSCQTCWGNLSEMWFYERCLCE